MVVPDSIAPRTPRDEQCNMDEAAVDGAGDRKGAEISGLVGEAQVNLSGWDGRPAGDPREDGSPVSSLPETVMLMDKAPPPSRSLQQGRNLYTVINAVPVRRWKEFVRGLGLQDGEIELVELEHSQFREQQYEMLKRWCQQRGASLVAILDTLEAMQLGGCAQELKEKLQVELLWDKP
ncbi:hypothetical protein L345_15514, partial [Ophiophagus hannah]